MPICYVRSVDQTGSPFTLISMQEVSLSFPKRSVSPALDKIQSIFYVGKTKQDNSVPGDSATALTGHTVYEALLLQTHKKKKSCISDTQLTELPKHWRISSLYFLDVFIVGYSTDTWQQYGHNMQF